jgi:hypothetical protein
MPGNGRPADAYRLARKRIIVSDGGDQPAWRGTELCFVVDALLVGFPESVTRRGSNAHAV